MFSRNKLPKNTADVGTVMEEQNCSKICSPLRLTMHVVIVEFKIGPLCLKIFHVETEFIFVLQKPHKMHHMRHVAHS